MHLMVIDISQTIHTHTTWFDRKARAKESLHINPSHSQQARALRPLTHPSGSPLRAGLTTSNSWATTSKTTAAPLRMSAAPAVMKKQSVGDLGEADLKGKKVLVRCDLNVPLSDGVIGDDTRIRASIPTVEYLLSKGARVALSSHLGRPKGGPEEKFSLKPVAGRLTELLGKECKMAPDCIGDDVGSMVSSLGDGDVMLLENVRFYKEETANDAGEEVIARRLDHLTRSRRVILLCVCRRG